MSYVAHRCTMICQKQSHTSSTFRLNSLAETINRERHLWVECIGDEWQMNRINALNTLLYDVVAILILDTFEHIAVQLLSYLHLDHTHIHSADTGCLHTLHLRVFICKTLQHFSFLSLTRFPSVHWHCLLGNWRDIWHVKNWVLVCGW